jgi:hypothetical protein
MEVVNMAATPGWPARAPGFPGIWLDRMRAYVDRAASAPPTPGAPVALTPIAPALPLEAYPSVLVPNGDGTVTLGGGVRINTDPGGERGIFTPPEEYWPAKNETHPVVANIESASPSTIVMGVNVLPASDGGGIFLIFPEIPADAFALVWLDAVTYRLASP